MATVIKTIGITGIEGYPTEVQVKLLSGLSVVNIIGLGDQAVKEVVMWLEKRLIYKYCKEDVESELKVSKLDFYDVIGPPGCGKSMISKHFPTILPELSEEEVLEVMTIQSVAGTLSNYTRIHTSSV